MLKGSPIPQILLLTFAPGSVFDIPYPSAHNAERLAQANTLVQQEHDAFRSCCHWYLLQSLFCSGKTPSGRRVEQGKEVWAGWAMAGMKASDQDSQ